MTAAAHLCLAAALAFGIFVGLLLGQRQTAPFETTIPWSAEK